MKMSKLRKALCTVMAAAMMLCLSSCMAMENGIIINEDGTVRVFCDTTVEKEMLESMEMTEDEFFSSVNESETAEGYEGFTTEAIETEIDGKAYIGQRYYKDMTYDELNSYVQGEADSNVTSGYSVVREGGKLTVTITYTNKSEGEEDTDEMTEYVAQGMMTTTQSVSAPYEILETNGTIDSETGTVTWDTLEVFTGATKEAVYTVTYKVGSPLPLGLIIGIAAALVIVIIVMIVVVAKKNSKASSDSQDAVDFSSIDDMSAQENSFSQAYTDEQTDAPVEKTAIELEEEYAKVRAPQKTCGICGTKCDASAQYCSICGAKI